MGERVRGGYCGDGGRGGGGGGQGEENCQQVWFISFDLEVTKIRQNESRKLKRIEILFIDNLMLNIKRALKSTLLIIVGF